MSFAGDRSKWMLRCLELARNGAGDVASNPMVGAVLVKDGRILAEGWHRSYGGAHAEVECLRQFGEQDVPNDAVLYVDLEPCAHHGKTPPCADLIIQRGIRNVVIGQRDPFPQVAGKGIERLKAAGVNVEVGIEEAACHWQQRRFLTSIEMERPYIILKWARSADGFLDRQPRKDRGVLRISNNTSNTLVHRWRSEEQAIMVGTRTVINDDPQLTVRLVEGRQPLRVVLDRNGATPVNSKIYDTTAPTLLFTKTSRTDLEAIEQVMTTSADPLEEILHALHERSIRSILVEGGAQLLNTFLKRDLWDEARVITGTPFLGNGTPAPTALPDPQRTLDLDGDRLDLFVHPQRHVRVDPRWHW
jgi:diaminohydroxyphosphoribosylaminopyrimidine deaminase/5-amino-6-(5-phosphoribosylamino)uracil reductase